MLGPYTIYIWLGVLAVTNGLTWYLTAEYKDNSWGMAVAKLQIEEASQLQTATDNLITIERISSAKVRDLEALHEQEETKLSVIEQRNRQLARELGGLRDPGRRSSSPNPMPSTSPDTACIADASTEGLLSREASEVLLNAAAEVDALANYAMVGYKYAQTVNPPQEEK